MGADGAGDKGQGVLQKNDLQGLLGLARSHELQIRGDILVDGAALLAGSHETVGQGHRTFDLSGGKGLHGLHMVLVGLSRFHQLGHTLGVHALKSFSLVLCENLSDLLQSLVAAGL